MADPEVLDGDAVSRGDAAAATMVATVLEAEEGRVTSAGNRGISRTLVLMAEAEAAAEDGIEEAEAEAGIAVVVGEAVVLERSVAAEVLGRHVRRRHASVASAVCRATRSAPVRC